jgi:hypothetical protein
MVIYLSYDVRAFSDGIWSAEGSGQLSDVIYIQLWISLQLKPATIPDVPEER